jgi:hypothetical protein
MSACVLMLKTETQELSMKPKQILFQSTDTNMPNMWYSKYRINTRPAMWSGEMMEQAACNGNIAFLLTVTERPVITIKSIQPYQY